MQRLCAIFALVLCAGIVLAADIVTMPTANQLKKGEVEVAAYYLDLKKAAPAAPAFVNYETLYVGVTNWLEVDVHQANVDRDKNSTVFVGSVKLLSETPTLPDVVVGARNFTGAQTTNAPVPSKLTSYFVCTAKTFFKDKPGPPLVRLHLSYGTDDWTLLAEDRHNGFFGGMQFLLTPQIGAVGEYDGQNLITGLTYMPKGAPGVTLKAGTYGKHTWVGVAYNKTLF